MKQKSYKSRSLITLGAINRSGAGRHSDKREKFGKQARQRKRLDERAALLSAPGHGGNVIV